MITRILSYAKKKKEKKHGKPKKHDRAFAAASSCGVITKVNLFPNELLYGLYFLCGYLHAIGPFSN